jgi:alpha-galactosidase
MIGAGSVVFSKNLTGDILSHPEFRDATLSYMDIDRDRLEVGAALCRKVAAALGASPKIEATLDRREALRGADFVIVMVQVGGFDNTLVDFEIPRKYGLNFTIADTTGPGGLMRALRSYPFYRDLVRDLHDVAPDAWLLNYTNPMSMNMQSIARNGHTRAVGLCHSVQGTFNELMRYLGEDPHDPALRFVCAGINHMAFYQTLEKDGQDLYPRLFAMADERIAAKQNAVRFELMKRLGYYVTESSEHNAEYSPWFIPRGRKAIEKFSVPIDEYLRRCDGIVDEFERMKAFSKSTEPMQVRRSHEYGSTIIHSTVTGKPSVVYGNMPNRGAVANLPADAIAEVPTLVDRNGCQFVSVGALPPQLIGYMQPHVTQHELFIRAALEGRRDHVYQAAMFDPLTGATLSPDQVVAMVDELIAGHGFEKDGGFLPNLDAKRSLVPTSGKTFTPPTPQQLRSSWDNAQKQRVADYVGSFHVIGPFKAPGEKVDLDFRTPIDDELARTGTVDLAASHKAGDTPLKWKKASAGKNGAVDLIAACGRVDWAVAFACVDVEDVHGREVELRLGSDDGARVWVNGKQVFTHDVGRGYSADSDRFTAYLKPGTNRIVVKITQYVGGWSFGLAVPKANF